MNADRRSILVGVALVAATPAAFAQTQRQVTMPASPVQAISLSGVRTAAQFYAGVLPRAEMSLSTSQIGIEKITNRNAHEFAGFELGEAITVNMVLKDIMENAPAMDMTSEKALVEKMMATARGAAFDRAYIAFQLENHEALRDMADGYLHNSAGTTDAAEKHGRHLASLMLAVFKEHVAICKRISADLKS